jgi:hypothetical protein
MRQMRGHIVANQQGVRMEKNKDWDKFWRSKLEGRHYSGNSRSLTYQKTEGLTYTSAEIWNFSTDSEK